MWQYAGNHFEKADHGKMIRKILTAIKENNIAVSMASGEYSFEKIVLSDVNKTSMQFNKPLNFPDYINSLKIMFKDVCDIYYIFDVLVLSSSYGTLYTSVPKEILRMQRRAEIRVATPDASRVRINTVAKKELCTSLRNLSVTGMLIGMREDSEEISAGDVIRKISIVVPQNNNIRSATRKGLQIEFPVISKGKIVHNRLDPQTNSRLYGVCFQGHHKARTMIKEYVMSAKGLVH